MVNISEVNCELVLSAEIKLVSMIKLKGKVKNFALLRIPTTNSKFTMALILQNNQIELTTLSLNEGSHFTANIENDGEISRYGHRHEINQVVIDGYNNSFISLSRESLKLWDFHQNQLIKTVLTSDNHISFTACIFVPGNRFIVVATNQGELQVYNLVDSTLIETVFAVDLSDDHNTFNIGLNLTADQVFILLFFIILF